MYNINAATHFLESPIFVAYFGAAVSLIAGIISSIATIARPKRLVLVDIPQVGIPLHEAPPSDWPDIIPVEPEKNYDDLRVAKLQLKVVGRWDISSSAFDQDSPITVDVGVPILSMKIDRPSDSPHLKAETSDTRLKIGPGLLRRRHRWTFTLLTNGPAALVICMKPLIDADILSSAEYRRRRLRYLVLAIISFLFFVRYVYVLFLISIPARILSAIGNVVIALFYVLVGHHG